MPFAEPGGGQQAKQQRERQEAGEEREQPDTLDVVGVTLVQAQPVAAMHHVTAADQGSRGRSEASPASRPSQQAPPPVSSRMGESGSSVAVTAANSRVFALPTVTMLASSPEATR